MRQVQSSRRVRSWAIGVVALFSLLFVAAACDDVDTEPVESRDDSFRVSSAPRLVVNGFNGRIVVNTGSDGTIRVQATLKKADKIDYKTTKDGDTVSVEAKEKGRSISIFGQSPGAEIEVTVPVQTIVELRTSNGGIEIYGIERSGTLRTSNGKIVMENVKGDFDADTSNGSITVSTMEGTVKLETSNGRINFTGELTPGGINEMKTSNGSITVSLEGEPSVELDASTSNGSVSSKLPILASSTGDHHLAGSIGNAEAELNIRTSNGSVTVQ